MFKIYHLIIVILFSVQSAWPQDIRDIRITGSFSETPFREFICSLEESYGIRIFYKEEWTESIEITGIFVDEPLIQVLDEIFGHTELDFKFFQNYAVFIYPRTSYRTSVLSSNGPKPHVIGDPTNLGRYKQAMLRGQVLEGKTGQPLPGAVIYNEETGFGVAADSEGRYSIELPTGFIHLRISYIGFQNQLLDIQLIEDGSANFELFEESHEIAEVTIVSESAKTSKAQTSIVKMTSNTLRELPALMGEADLIKSIGMMPGIQSIGEVSSGFNVRGGNTDQNLVLLDGAPVFNTTHLFGFLSMINPDAVGDVTLYKGGIPSSYGERISSVMEVESEDGNHKSLQINGGIGLISNRLSFSGPIVKKKKSSFLLGARSTYSDWLLRQTRNPVFINSETNFYDLHGSAKIELGPENHIKLMGYLSSDFFNLNSSSLYRYGNTISSLNWTLTPSDKIVSRLTIACSRYDSKISQKNPDLPRDDYLLTSGIQYSSLKYGLSIYPNDNHRIHTGFQTIGYWIHPGKIDPAGTPTNVIGSSMQKERSLEIAVFADDDFDLSEKLACNIGLRVTRFMNFGPGKVYAYAPGFSKEKVTTIDTINYGSGAIIKYYHGLEPRVLIKYDLANRTSLRFSYQRIHQYINQISNTAVISPADYWKSSDLYLPPLVNDQVTLGLYKNAGIHSLEASAEIYYRKMKNLWEYKNGAQLFMNDHLETDIHTGNGYSYGIELFVRKNIGQLKGWISYTYSKTFQRSDGLFPDEIINSGVYYPSVYDKPHDISVVINYRISRRWRFSVNFVFSSGRPITLPEQKYKYAGNEVVIYSDRNKYRMPPYHRMDVAITLGENLRKRRMWKGSWTFSIYNLYGRNNPYSVFYRKIPSVQDTDQMRYAIYKLSVIGIPVPSITYNFRY